MHLIPALCILAVSFMYCTSQTRYVAMQQDLILRDQISDLNPWKVVKVVSKAACVGECLKDSACGSLFFRGDMCVMYPTRMKAIYSVVYNSGWQFYHKNQSKLCM